MTNTLILSSFFTLVTSVHQPLLILEPPLTTAAFSGVFSRGGSFTTANTNAVLLVERVCSQEVGVSQQPNSNAALLVERVQRNVSRLPPDTAALPPPSRLRNGFSRRPSEVCSKLVRCKLTMSSLGEPKYPEMCIQWILSDTEARRRGLAQHEWVCCSTRLSKGAQSALR